MTRPQKNKTVVHKFDNLWKSWRTVCPKFWFQSCFASPMTCWSSMLAKPTFLGVWSWVVWEPGLWTSNMMSRSNQVVNDPARVIPWSHGHLKSLRVCAPYLYMWSMKLFIYCSWKPPNYKWVWTNWIAYMGNVLNQFSTRSGYASPQFSSVALTNSWLCLPLSVLRGPRSMPGLHTGAHVPL